MKWHSLIPILCVLVLLSVAIAGCTVSLNPPNIQFNPSQSSTGTPAGINSQGTTNGTAHMLAVEQLDDNSYVGAVSNVVVYTQPGTGHVFVETAPVTGVDFQETARTAVTVAAERANVNANQRDFEFVLSVPKGVDAVDGPSAGLPMTIAAYSAILKKPTNQSVYSTGTIDVSGAVGDVGGVYWKAEAAASNGARVILVPYDETVVNTTSPLETSPVGGVNLQSQLKHDGYNVTVVGVNNIDDALPYYF
ncbi:MAG TPA: S16 family serine protease [Candidatus Bathyarchaeia archaeon]|nr:S16 family serine protease [Candidatus Bathyarchaeia archaeon]